MNGTTQCDRILRYIDETGSITWAEAAYELGISSLHRRLSDLREQGYDFAKTDEKSHNRYGDKVDYKRYRLVREGQQCLSL